MLWNPHLLYYTLIQKKKIFYFSPINQTRYTYCIPKREFIHNSLANTSGTVAEESGDDNRSLPGLIVHLLPLRIPEPRHIPLHIESAANIQLLQLI